MTTAQEILSAYPSDMEPEEWALVLPGLQARMVQAESDAAAFKEARNVVIERALDVQRLHLPQFFHEEADQGGDPRGGQEPVGLWPQ